MAAAVAAAAAWADLGSLHRLENGDSLVPILVSLQRWTPFFWGQDRFGMLVPLLAWPARSPLGNLLLQHGLTTFAGLLAFVLLARYAFPRPGWELLGTAGAALFLALAPRELRFDYLAAEPYGPALALGLGALLLAERAPGPPRGPSWRTGLALGLMVLAHWVNAGAALLLGPLLLSRALLAGGDEGAPGEVQERPPGAWGRLGPGLRARLQDDGAAWTVLLVGAAAGWGFNRLSAFRDTQLNPASIREWPEAWGRLLHATLDALEPRGWLYLLLAAGCAGLGARLLAPASRRALRGLLPCVALLASAAAYGLAIGTLKWLRLSGYSARYAEPGLVLLQAALLAPLLLPAGAWLRARAGRAGVALQAILLLGAAAVAYGPPSLAGVRDDLARLSPAGAEVLAAGCTHVAGSYWTVWPAVFEASRLRDERGEPGDVWGLTYRSRQTRGLARAVPPERMRVAIPIGEEKEAAEWLAAYGYPPLEALERRRYITVLHPRPTGPGSAAR